MNKNTLVKLLGLVLASGLALSVSMTSYAEDDSQEVQTSYAQDDESSELGEEGSDSSSDEEYVPSEDDSVE